MIMNINDATKQMTTDFENEVHQFIREYVELQRNRELEDDDIDFSKMFVFATDINADWLPQLAPISYGIIGEQVYSFVPNQTDGIACEPISCEPICMWD